MNPVLAPRSKRCMVCTTVSDLSDVAVRLWEESPDEPTGVSRIPAGTWRVAEYLESIGFEGKRALEGRAQTHRKHVEEFLARPSQAIAPMQLIPGGKQDAAASTPTAGVLLPPPRTGPARWTDVQQNAMDVGDDALRLLAGRLQGMENQDLIAVAKLGAATAGKRGDLEAKGKRLSQIDDLIQMAAGLPRQAPKQVGPEVIDP